MVKFQDACIKIEKRGLHGVGDLFYQENKIGHQP